MLSEKEKRGCLAILHILPDEEVVALAQTTTAHQLAFTSRKEAVDAVLTFTAEAADLLKRKKMKRNYLFRYLAEVGVPVPGTADKNQLVYTILELWGSDVKKEKLRIDLPESQQSQLEQEQLQHQQQIQHQQQQHMQQHHNHQQHQQQEQHMLQNQLQQQSNNAVKQYEPECNGQKLSLAFAKWFYDMLNSQNPASGIANREMFGPQHFYSDCTLQLFCMTSKLDKMEYMGAELIAQRLRALVCEEQLLLNPNLCPEGTRGQSEPHGLNRIFVCGTIHQRDMVIGIFEQQFGLVQEPVSNTWKIKFTNLKLRTQDRLEQMPTLQHTSQTLAIEA